MQKYKRPGKYKGPRSIPLRNPRNVDWHRWDENNNKIVNRKPSFADGVTAESFAPSNRGLSVKTAVETEHQLVIFSTEYECLTLFYTQSNKPCRLEHAYLILDTKYISRQYINTEEAKSKVVIEKGQLRLTQVRWVRREPIAK